MIWPILEARAETQKYFRSFFGSNENFKICFREDLTFSKRSVARARSRWYNIFSICIQAKRTAWQNYIHAETNLPSLFTDQSFVEDDFCASVINDHPCVKNVLSVLVNHINDNLQEIRSIRERNIETIEMGSFFLSYSRVCACQYSWERSSWWSRRWWASPPGSTGPSYTHAVPPVHSWLLMLDGSSKHVARVSRKTEKLPQFWHFYRCRHIP